MPFADVGPVPVESSLDDEQVLFLSDIFPTGWLSVPLIDRCNIVQAGGHGRLIQQFHTRADVQDILRCLTTGLKIGDAAGPRSI